MKRFWEIDFLRGIAILMMIAFHFAWDLNYFGYTNLILYAGFLGLFQKATAGLFIFLVGVSMVLSYKNRKQDYAKHFLRRGTKVFGMGLLITTFTLIAFPQNFIFFGVLHLIGVSIMLAIPFVKREKLALALGTIILLTAIFFNYASIGISELTWVGLAEPNATFDFFPVLPWFGVVLIGLFIGNTFLLNRKESFVKKPTKIVNPIIFLGKNALLVYFIHQPILFALFFIITSII